MRTSPLIFAALTLFAGAAGTLCATLPAARLHQARADEAPQDTIWSDRDLSLVRSLSLDALPPLPADPSNHVADDPKAAALGQALFSDPRFSANGKVACATCHNPARQFQDDLALGRGVGQTGRRTMPITGTAYAPFLFWDGRKDSLWAQALGPLESAVEHGGDRAQYARLIADHYGADYDAVFGPLPDLAGIPAHAGPVADPAVAAAWDKLSPKDRKAVSTVFANMGKAIAAYERVIAPPRTRFDDWVASPDFPGAGILTPDEIAGARLFIGKGECVNCHNGALFTDNHFHNTGIPAAAHQSDANVDRGRADGMRLVLTNEFNCLGPFSDAKPNDCAELRFMAAPQDDALGAFKTPSLRGVASRSPYMNAGQITTLRSVIDHYASAPAAPLGQSELRAKSLTVDERARLIAFLSTLDALVTRSDTGPNGGKGN